MMHNIPQKKRAAIHWSFWNAELLDQIFYRDKTRNWYNIKCLRKTTVDMSAKLLRSYYPLQVLCSSLWVISVDCAF